MGPLEVKSPLDIAEIPREHRTDKHTTKTNQAAEPTTAIFWAFHVLSNYPI